MHEWSGDFQGRPVRFRMTSVIGHVLSIDFPPKFQNWDQNDPLTLFTAPTIRGEANPKVRRVPPPSASAVVFTVSVAHLRHICCISLLRLWLHGNQKFQKFASASQTKQSSPPSWHANESIWTSRMNASFLAFHFKYDMKPQIKQLPSSCIR